MNIAMFYHSLVSDWNHGNAHFLRGIYSSLLKLGHQVIVFEERNNWSLSQLVRTRGQTAIEDFRSHFPLLEPYFYDKNNTTYDEMVNDADLVIVHEWNDPSLIKKIGRLKDQYGYILLFHDTHHRGISAKNEIRELDLSDYDGVLAFGKSLRKIYLDEGWHHKVWTWHEAADTHRYYPRDIPEKKGDLIWIGNWGDDERTEEISEYLVDPVKRLGLKATFYGVRYPESALLEMESAGITYGGYLPTHKVAEEYAKFKFTVHVPRKFYREHLPGIPTIRPFEAMACKIPLFSAPWEDCENLFREGEEFIMVRNGNEMIERLSQAEEGKLDLDQMAENGYRAVRERHSCDIRAQQLLDLYYQLQTNKKDERRTI